MAYGQPCYSVNWRSCLGIGRQTDGELREPLKQTILIQASIEEGATIIPKGSRAKWPEAPSTQTG